MVNMSIDPVCGMIVDEKSASFETRYKGYAYYFCTSDCKEAFKTAPKKYLLGIKEHHHPGETKAG